MSPSKLVRRASIVSGVATGTFLIAMAATPAYAIGTPTLTAGAACPPAALASLIPDTLTCVNGVLVTITSQLPVPTSAPTTAAPKTSPAPSPQPNPLSGVVSGVTGAVNNLGNTVTGAVGGLLGGASPAPSLPGTPSTAPGGSTSTSGGSTGSGTGTTTGGTSSSNPAPSPTASTADGSGLLGPAAAFLPGTGIAGFTDLAGSSLSAEAIPAPELASPDTKLAAVQAPLIAAGERASQAASSPFSRFGSKALPGILIVLATGMVAAVGAGNLRVWQAKLAARKSS